jgi:hypothetical protein
MMAAISSTRGALGTAIDQIDDGLGGLLCVHGLPPPRVTITRRHAGKSLADGIGMSARRKECEDQDDQQKCKKGNCYECMHLKAPQQTVQPTQNRDIFLKRNRKNIQMIVK